MNRLRIPLCLSNLNVVFYSIVKDPIVSLDFRPWCQNTETCFWQYIYPFDYFSARICYPWEPIICCLEWVEGYILHRDSMLYLCSFLKLLTFFVFCDVDYCKENVQIFPGSRIESSRYFVCKFLTCEFSYCVFIPNI